MTQTTEELRSSLSEQMGVVDGLFKSRPFEVLLRRPSPNKWSAAEHVEHLSVVNELYLASIRQTVGRARDRGWLDDGPYGGGWLGEQLIATQDPPPRRRFPAFRKTVPAPDLDCERVIERFRNAQQETLDALDDAQGVDLGRARLRSPLFPLLKLSAMQGFRLIEAHNGRHIWHMGQTLTLSGAL